MPHIPGVLIIFVADVAVVEAAVEIFLSWQFLLLQLLEGGGDGAKRVDESKLNLSALDVFREGNIFFLRLRDEAHSTTELRCDLHDEEVRAVTAQVMKYHRQDPRSWYCRLQLLCAEPLYLKINKYIRKRNKL